MVLSSVLVDGNDHRRGAFCKRANEDPAAAATITLGSMDSYLKEFGPKFYII